MKKLLPIVAAMTALFVSSCQKEAEKQIDPISNGKVTVLKASVTEAETKVSADAAGKFAWQSGDAITAFDNSNNNLQFTTTNGGTDTEFTFSGDATLGTYAIYPYDAKHEVTGDYVWVSLPNEYTYKADETNMPMLGKIENNQASFKAIGGVLKLIIYNVPEGATKLTFTATNKQISGLFDIDDASIAEPVIATANTDTAADKSVAINFTRQANMVFYIPLPTGTIDGFTLAFDGANSTTKTVTASFNVGRNKIINAPALNASAGAPVSDAVLSNSDIVNNLTGSYSVKDITNSAGTWTVSGMKGGNYSSSGNYYAQIRKNNTVSYIQLPSFANDIATIVLEDVCNSSEALYSGNIFFRTTADNDAAAVVTATASTAKEDVTLIIPAGYTTGYIMSSAACLIKSVTVTFSTGTSPTIPIINVDPTSATIGAGALEASINGIILENPLDNQGISVASVDADWLDVAFTERDFATGAKLTATAKTYNHDSSARTATVTLKATGAATKTVTFKQNPSIVGKPTISAEPGDKTFTVSWTGDSKVETYVAYYSETSGLSNPASTGTALNVSHVNNAYTAVPDETLTNGTTYYVYVKASALTSSNSEKYIIADEWAEDSVSPIGIHGSVDSPMGADEIVDIIDAGTGLDEFYYVEGTVTVASPKLYSGGMLSFTFGEGSNNIKAYNCLGLNGAAFIDVSDVEVGDYVVVYGNLEKYNDTYEVVNGHLAKITKADPAKVYTYTFSNKSWGANESVSSGTAPGVTWSGTDGNQLTSGQGVQITTVQSGVSVTSSKKFTGVSKIVVTYCTNASKGAGAIKVKVGTGTQKSFTVSKPSSGGTSLKAAQFTFDSSEDGAVNLVVDCSTNSIYIYSIAITAD